MGKGILVLKSGLRAWIQTEYLFLEARIQTSMMYLFSYCSTAEIRIFNLPKIGKFKSLLWSVYLLEESRSMQIFQIAGKNDCRRDFTFLSINPDACDHFTISVTSSDIASAGFLGGTVIWIQVRWTTARTEWSLIWVMSEIVFIYQPRTIHKNTPVSNTDFSLDTCIGFSMF